VLSLFVITQTARLITKGIDVVIQTAKEHQTKLIRVETRYEESPDYEIVELKPVAA
jgi:hypothetical protein